MDRFATTIAEDETGMSPTPETTTPVQLPDHNFAQLQARYDQLQTTPAPLPLNAHNSSKFNLHINQTILLQAMPAQRQRTELLGP